ncbi:LysR family transcriptional regulator [Candidatus Methylospira mobilis]|nr:LysR family transcriptional regulator [Candidatus Methylospira mobilis]WNV03090.1 LysR family transcriptional regulator [Candidatus Methylospira mobilis]
MPRLKTKRTSSMLLSADSGKSEHAAPRLKLNLRLLHGDVVAMGPGKADLLDFIVKTGSISQAGREMGMSYRRAWVLVDEMNHCFKKPLVITSKGGAVGGGARLSELGEQVLAHYRKMATAAADVALAYVGVFEALMADDKEAPTGE